MTNKICVCPCHKAWKTRARSHGGLSRIFLTFAYFRDPVLRFCAYMRSRSDVLLSSLYVSNSSRSFCNYPWLLVNKPRKVIEILEESQMIKDCPSRELFATKSKECRNSLYFQGDFVHVSRPQEQFSVQVLAALSVSLIPNNRRDVHNTLVLICTSNSKRVT